MFTNAFESTMKYLLYVRNMIGWYRLSLYYHVNPVFLFLLSQINIAITRSKNLFFNDAEDFLKNVTKAIVKKGNFVSQLPLHSVKSS